MTGQPDDYLAQLDRALERIEATNIDSELAADHAPHLLASGESPALQLRRGDPVAPKKTTDSEKIDLAVSLMQSDVVSLTPSGEMTPSQSFHEESGLSLELIQEARTAAESFSSASLPSMSMGPHNEVSVSRSLDGPTLVHNPVGREEPVPSAPQEAALTLESQQFGLGAAANSAPVSPSPRPSLSARSSSSVGSGEHQTKRVARRRGLFHAQLGVNTLVALGVATWLALGPAYMWTTQELSEGSHVAMAQFKASIEDAQVPLAESKALASPLLAQADQAQQRFLWGWALVALVGTVILALPYRRESV